MCSPMRRMWCSAASRLSVLEGGPHVLQRGVIALPRQALAQGPERVDHADVPGVQAEVDLPGPPGVGHQLVVDQRAPQVHEPGEHRHVVGLALGHVGEADVRAPRLQSRGRHLLHAEYDLALLQVGIDAGACVEVVLIGERPGGRRLDRNADPLIRDDVADVVGNERRAAFPSVLVFGAETNASHTLWYLARRRITNCPATGVRR